MPCSAFHPDQHPMTAESEESGFIRKSKAQMTKEIRDLKIKVCNAEMSLCDAHERLRVQKIQSNRAFLDLRRRLLFQEELIRNLRTERDGLMNSLTSRLLLVEGELRKEQKHIEMLLEEKDRIIEQQEQELRQLKNLQQNCSSVSSSVTSQNSQRSKNHRAAATVSKRFSLALDEYIRDCTTVSRASPIFLDGEAVKPLNRVRPCVLNFEKSKSSEKCISQIPISPSGNDSGHDGSKARNPHQRDSKDSISAVDNNTMNIPRETSIQLRSRNYFPLKKSNAVSLPELRGKPSSEDASYESEESNPSRFHSNSFLHGSNSVIKVPWYRPPCEQSLTKPERFSDVLNSSPSSFSVTDSDSLGSSEQSDSLDSGISMQSFYKCHTPPEPSSPPSSLHDNDSFSYARDSGKCSCKSHPESSSSAKPFSVTVTNSKYPCSLSTAVISSELDESLNRDKRKNISRICLKTDVQNQMVDKRLSKSSSDASVNSPTHAVNVLKAMEVRVPTSKNKGNDLSGSCERLTTTNHGVNSWVSGSANRSFGTNHRSVTKLRDIKFKKLSKFQNRLIGDPSSPIDVRGLVNEVILTV